MIENRKSTGRIHGVTDISHEFTFYFDGRFGRNYVGENGLDVRNWGTLGKYDFGNANLLVLQSCGLLEMDGFEFTARPAGYISKCDLCLDIRKQLRREGNYPEIEPEELYT